MALGTKPIAITAPQCGSFSLTRSTAGSSQYPEDGRGSTTTTAGNAHWTDLGLAAGEFEVEITAIVVAAGGVLSIAELKASGTAHLFPGGGSIGSGGGGVPASITFAAGAGPRMQDGFIASFITAGGTIFYKIHAYHNKDAGY